MNDFLPQPELAPPGRLELPDPDPGPAGQRHRDRGLPAARTARGLGPPGARHPAERGGPGPRGRGHDLRPGARRGQPAARRRGVRRAAGDRGRRLRGRDRRWPGCRRCSTYRSPHLEPALQLFAEAVREPSLAERDVNRHVQLRLAEIEQAQANSAQTASIAFRAAVFDRGQPGVPDERRRAGDGRPRSTPRPWPPSTPTTSDRPGRPWSWPATSAADPVALAERYLGGWQQPRPAGRGRPGARPPRRAGCC